jgi:hypothetical protein
MARRKNPTVIEFQAQVWNIKTLVDGGINVTLALSDKSIEQIAQLLECKNSGFMLEVAAVPVKPETHAKKEANTKGDNKGRKRYPYST